MTIYLLKRTSNSYPEYAAFQSDTTYYSWWCRSEAYALDSLVKRDLVHSTLEQILANSPTSEVYQTLTPSTHPEYFL